MSDSKLPVARLRIIDTDKANEEILAYAELLVARNERPWFEVLYPAPDYLTDEEKAAWNDRQEHIDGGTYDAVEVIDGEIHTLPPYSELLGEDS